MSRVIAVGDGDDDALAIPRKANAAVEARILDEHRELAGRGVDAREASIPGCVSPPGGIHRRTIGRPTERSHPRVLLFVLVQDKDLLACAVGDGDDVPALAARDENLRGVTAEGSRRKRFRRVRVFLVLLVGLVGGRCRGLRAWLRFGLRRQVLGLAACEIPDEHFALLRVHQGRAVVSPSDGQSFGVLGRHHGLGLCVTGRPTDHLIVGAANHVVVSLLGDVFLNHDRALVACQEDAGDLSLRHAFRHDAGGGINLSDVAPAIFTRERVPVEKRVLRRLDDNRAFRERLESGGRFLLARGRSHRDNHASAVGCPVETGVGGDDERALDRHGRQRTGRRANHQRDTARSRLRARRRDKDGHARAITRELDLPNVR